MRLARAKWNLLEKAALGFTFVFVVKSLESMQLQL